MSELDPRTRALIELARGHGTPTPDDAARVRASLASRIAAPDAAQDVARVGGKLGLKVLAVVVVTVAAAAVWFALRSAPTPVEVQPPAVPPSSAVRVEETLVTPPVETPPVPVVPARAPPRRTKTPPRSTFGEEMELLGRGRVALRGGAFDEALSALDEHARRFPRGVLREERQAMHAQALCSSGDLARGRREAQVFHEEFPSSALGAAMDAKCGTR